jgi:hypothetical protein
MGSCSIFYVVGHDEHLMEIIPLMCSRGSTKIGAHLTSMGYVNFAKSYVNIGVCMMEKPSFPLPCLIPLKLAPLPPRIVTSILQNPMLM